MLKALFVSLKLSLFTFACLFTSPTLAQVTTDGTVNTQVNQNGNIAEITGGESRGSNLFHSFQDFSVQTGNEAFFNNADNISNIFSRVTGGNISNIDGAIRANGSASLFLINPAGIIFGNNARLDIGGSFYGSTASSILFEDGEFSAVDNLSQPTLTINAPIGLGFRDEPGDIVNRSQAESSSGEIVGLEISPSSDNNLAFIGGNLNFEAGNVTGKGGNIYLGGLRETGTVNLNDDGSLNFPDNVTLANITLTNGADINVIGTRGGSIIVDAQNLTLGTGEFSSSIRGGIDADSTNPEVQAGDITINAAENIAIDNSIILNQVAPEGVSDSGNIIINTNILELTNGGIVTAGTFGTGDAGAVEINATENITVDGENSSGSQSIISSGVARGAERNAGGVTISTTNLNLTNGGKVFASTFGIGDAGAVNVTATENIVIDEGTIETSSGISSGAINITAKNLTIGNQNKSAESFNFSNISSTNGDININVGNSVLLADGEIEAGIGNIQIKAREISLTNIIEDGDTFSSSFEGSGIRTINDIEGNSGDVDLIADIITVDKSRISTRILTRDIGTPVPFGIEVFDISEIEVADIDRSQDVGGDISISTKSLSILNGAEIGATTRSEIRSGGDAGNVKIVATEKILVDGNLSEILSETADSGTGNAGNVEITTPQLTLSNNGFISTLTSNLGDAGDITINASESVEVNSGGLIGSDTDFGSIGNGGSLTITTPKLTVSGGGFVLSTTRGTGKAGDINIFASDSVKITGTDDRFPSNIQARAIESNGAGGEINILTGNLTVSDEGIIDVGNFPNRNSAIRRAGIGEPGNISIQADSVSVQNGGQITSITQFSGGESANIDLQVAKNIILQDGGLISAQAINEGNGGNLNIDTNFIIAFPNGNNDIIASAEQGNGGNININAESLFGIAERPLSDGTNDINASSEFSLDGTVEISTPDINPVQGATELPTKVIVPEETSQQACEANRESAAKNGLNITGKGGVVPEPGLPLDSLNITINGETSSTSYIPKPIETSIGKIQPARGIKVTQSGETILTAYRTNNVEQRIPEINRNCS